MGKYFTKTVSLNEMEVRYDAFIYQNEMLHCCKVLREINS